jgi:hypothetical protein
MWVFADHSPPETIKYLDRVLMFLQVLKTEADLTLFSIRRTNYEDLYFLANQIHEHIRGVRDNPALGPFLRSLKASLGRILEGGVQAERNVQTGCKSSEFVDGCSSVADLARECRNYIMDTAIWLLLKPHKPPSHLKWLADATRDHSFGRQVLFTLNHDLLLEEFLTAEKMTFADGFGEAAPGGTFRPWMPSCLEARPNLSLIKLHGSLHWFAEREFASCSDDHIPMACLADVTKAKEHCEASLERPPVILMGTHNKELAYNKFVFEELHRQFSMILREVQRLVVCGYGFSDYGINERLADWLDQAKTRRIIVVGPDPEGCRMRSTWRIARSWKRWEANEHRQIMCIQKTAKEVTWCEIRGACDSRGA